MTQTNVTRPQGLSRIDPALRATAEALGVVEFSTESLPDERERADRAAAERAAAADTTGVSVETRTIAGPDGGQLAIRLYRGAGAAALPLVIYAHGGAFVTGNLDTDHAHCVELARDSGTLVVSVGYRLAPEHPAPAALDDVEAALYYAVEHAAELDADASRIAVMGRDAGAALVAGLAQRTFDDEGPKILVQILHQPMLDSDATPSRREFQRTPGLNGQAVSRAWGHYLGHATANGQHVPAHRANLEGCRRPSSAAPTSIPAATRPSTTRTGCCTPTCRPGCTSSRRHSTASTRWCRIGLCPKRTGHCMRSRCDARSRCSASCAQTGVNLVISHFPSSSARFTSTLLAVIDGSGLSLLLVF